MPSSSPRVCPRCRSLHASKQRCPADDRHKDHDAVNRPSGRLSARPWRRLRDTVIAEQDGVCFAPDCHELIDEVDHRIPRHMRPDLTYVRENLQGLCKAHHDIKTAEEAAL